MERNGMHIVLESTWIEDIINILQWDLDTYFYSDNDKAFIVQQIDRLKNRMICEKELVISGDFLYYVKTAVNDVINNAECWTVAKERAWELYEELSKL